MLAEWKSSRYRIEVALLLGVCLVLPIDEAWKNRLWLAYLVAWLVNRVRARDFGGTWDRWDTLFALWISSGFAVAIAAQFGDIQGAEWRGAGDLLRYGSLGWLVKRGGYSPVEKRWIVGALVVSVLVGLAIGYVRLWTGIGKSGTLQLHSVGHVNHTAIYIAIMLGVWGAWFFAAYRRWTRAMRLAGSAILGVLVVALATTASRAAVGAGFLALAVLAVAWWSRWRAPAMLVAAIAMAVAVGAFALGTELAQKQEQYEARDNPLSHRDTAWRTGVEAWQRQPLFGIGMSNFQYLTADRVMRWRTQEGRPFDPAKFVFFPHGHSLYVNTLAERGVVGVAALFAVLGAWGVALLRARPAASADEGEWLLWGACTSALVVTLAAGALNTTLHHEHGILAVLLLGLWIGRPAQRASS